jgi:hypothetical protein
MRLPAGNFPQLGRCCAFRAPQQGEQLRRLAGARGKRRRLGGDGGLGQRLQLLPNAADGGPPVGKAGHRRRLRQPVPQRGQPRLRPGQGELSQLLLGREDDLVVSGALVGCEFAGRNHGY